MKTKTFPSLRISSATETRVVSALKKLNDSSPVEISLQDFRRISYNFLAQMILNDKQLPFKLTAD